MNSVEWIWELYGHGKLHLAADKKLHMDYEEKQVECLIIVGLWFARSDQNLRPSMRQAIQVLNFEAPLPNLPAKMPVPMFRAPSPSVSSATNNFSNERKLGGRVWCCLQGVPADLDIAVAVKKISRGSKQGKKEYITEVKVISRLRHRNVVQLIGKKLVEWIWDLYGSGKLSIAVDERLHQDFDKKEAECLMMVGLWCAHPDYNLRPTIRQAIHVLNFEAELPNLPTKMPVPLYHVPIPSVSSNEPLISYSSIEAGR
ncbi:hypothetical protein GH714_016660 [Hevea brasiliensis]|uniref:Protein kinase domain-containing protein n=1 Tax=Hevea brasiliensis TaxID=3981 RepID=A0A6A6K5A4_HEVBR|nr:hypothetical protein GH714_016660 [Hevea brasiliensis]